MKKQENDNSSEESEKRDILLLSSSIGNEKYLIKIYISKNNTTIIFKIEQEKIPTYYFYEKFDLRDLRKKDKKYISIDNINEAYINLKELINKSSISLEKKSSKMEVKFLNKLEVIISFTLRKKLVTQIRLNPLLIEKIQYNVNKLNEVDEQMIKIEKNIEGQNLIAKEIESNITNINNNIKNIKNNINEIKNINLNQENKNFVKEKEEFLHNIQKSNNEISKNINMNKSVDIRNILKTNNKSRNYIENKTNNNDLKNLIKNKDNLKNKSLLMIIGCDLICVLIVAYLIFLIYQIKNELDNNKIEEDKFQKKFKILYQNSQNKSDILKNIRKIKEYKKQKQIKLNEEENKKLSFKKKIMKHSSTDAKDIIFNLKFSSKNQKVNNSFDFKNMSNSLISIKYERGKTIYLFSKDNSELLREIKVKDYAKNMFKDSFINYFSDGRVNELYLDEYFNDFDGFINIFKQIILFLIDKKNFETSDINKVLFNNIEKINEIEIFEIQYIY